MTIDHGLIGSASGRADASSGGLLARLFREFAPHDWLVLAYAIGLNIAAFSAEATPARAASIQHMAGLLLFLTVTLLLVRGGFLRDGVVAPLLYRLGIYGTVQLSYFLLANLLPIVNTTTLDRELYELDLALFGMEPSVVLDRVVTPVTTEWFAFFYFGYFFLLALHVIPILMFSRRARVLSEFSLGMLIVFCVGQTLYMLVPGYGPYRAIADQFQRPFPHGMWLDLVMRTVASGGAQMDIFPSLHTAGPTFISLFSFRHRDKMPFRYTWPIVVFFTANIMVATLFLRWHYIIDVVAGFALACAAVALSAALTRRDFVRRAERGLSDAWPLFGKRKAAATMLLAPDRSFAADKEAA